jgi:hypothetical protein
MELQQLAESPARLEFPPHLSQKYSPEESEWITPLMLSAAAIDGLIQTSQHFAEFTSLNTDALKHIGTKTVELISKIESFNPHITDHVILAAEHGHEAWLGVLATFLAQHMVSTSIDHAVAAHHAISGASEHAAAALAVGQHGMMEGALHESASPEHAGMLADVHFPLMTVLFSSYREFKLLADEKTTFVRALKNVVVDGTGVAAGPTASRGCA